MRILIFSLISALSFISFPNDADAQSGRSRPLPNFPVDNSPVQPNPIDYDQGGDYTPGEMFNFEVRAYYWLTGFDAEIRVDGGDLSGTDIDVVDDLGLERSKGFPGVEATIKFAEKHKLKLNSIALKYSGSTIVDSQFTFNDVIYPAGVKADTSMDVNLFIFNYEYDFIREKEGYVSFRFGVEGVSTNVSIVTNDLLSNSANISVGVPVIGLAARMNFSEYVSMTGEVSGIAFDKSSMSDFTFYMDINPTRNVGLYLGYRAYRLDVDIDDKRGNIGWNGIMAGGAFRF